MKHVLRVINVLATVVILVAFVVLLRTVFTPAGEIPTIMGYGFMRTLTGSMEPAIPVHSFIVVDTDNSQAYQVGDIITFHSSDDALEGSLNTHRIVAVEAAADGTPVYRTKGDANPVEDAAPVPAADVVGRVVFVSAGLGVVASLLTNPLLFFPLIVVPLIVLLVLEIRHMVKTTQEVARAEDEAALRAAVEQIREKRRREQEEQGDAGDEGDADGGHTDESAEADPGAQAIPTARHSSSVPFVPAIWTLADAPHHLLFHTNIRATVWTLYCQLISGEWDGTEALGAVCT